MFSVIIVPFHWFDKKKSFPSNQNLHDLHLFTHVKKMFLSEEFLASYRASHFLVLQYNFFVNFRKNALKHQKSLVYLYVSHIAGLKLFSVIFIPFHWFE